MKVSGLTVATLLVFSIQLHAQLDDFKAINFAKADSMARLYPDHSLYSLPVLANKLTAPLATDVEKFRALYTWTCLNIENNYALFHKYQQQHKKQKGAQADREWNEAFTKVVFETLRKKNSTICTGYAYLLRELSTVAGIKCVIVNGYGRTAQSNIGETGMPNHSWNAVLLNNKWYVCDATWSSGVINEKGFVKKFNDSYFLPDPALFVRNHYPLDTGYLLLKNKPSLAEFLNRPLIYPALFDYAVRDLSPDTLTTVVKKNASLCFQLESETLQHNEVELVIKSSVDPSTSVHQLMNLEEGVHRAEHTFSSKGMYTVHLLAKNEYVATYTVRVEK